MKKAFYTLIFVFGIAANVNAKGFYILTCINHTTGDSSSQSFTFYPANINVSAEPGDSLTLYVYLNFSGALYLQTLGQWFYNGDSIQQSFNVNPLDVTAPPSGVYSVLAVNIVLMQFTIVSATGISGHIHDNGYLKVFPSITNSSLNIEMNLAKPGDVKIVFYDVKGKLLKESFYKNVAGEFVENENVAAFADGIYFIRVKTANEIFSEKFIKL